jgi:PAS domain-containing protein
MTTGRATGTDDALELREVIAHSPVVLFSLDAGGVLTRIEGKAMERLRVGPADLIGRSLFEILANYPLQQQVFRRALAGETVVETVDFGRLVYEVHCRPRLEGGRLQGVLGVAVDVTRDRRAQDELDRQRAFLRQVIDLNPNFIFAKDGEGRFLLVNQAVAELYGTTVEELTGRLEREVHPDPLEVERWSREDQTVIASGKEFAGGDVPRSSRPDPLAADGQTSDPLGRRSGAPGAGGRQRHHRAQAGRRADSLPGLPRSPDRSTQSAVVPRPPGRRHRSGPPQARGPGLDLSGPGSLQDHQRLARPWLRRRAVA